MSTADELEKLVRLRDQGVLSPEEFARQKDILLGSKLGSDIRGPTSLPPSPAALGNSAKTPSTGQPKSRAGPIGCATVIGIILPQLRSRLRVGARRSTVPAQSPRRSRPHCLRPPAVAVTRRPWSQ